MELLHSRCCESYLLSLEGVITFRFLRLRLPCSVSRAAYVLGSSQPPPYSACAYCERAPASFPPPLPLRVRQELKAILRAGHNGSRAEVEVRCGWRGAPACLPRCRHLCRCRAAPRLRPRLLPDPIAAAAAAMSASAVYVLDLKGKVLICRNYRGDVDMSEVEHFMPILMEKEEEGMLSPILAHGGVRFMWIKHNNLYLVATSKKNACVSLVFAFLYKVVQVFSEYFKELEEESIRDNFVIIYELLDELMDFGYPQTTDSKILQEYITQEGHKLETGAPRPPATVTNAVSWRSEGIKYRKNEVFLDVIESVNLLVSANGNVLRSEIVGSIKMRVFLSGMPELRLGLNDKVLFDNTGRGKSKSVELEDVKFHQCVRLSRFENDRTISFIPPDGEFELMSYRLNTHVKPLIWIESVIEKHSHSRIEYMIKAKSQFKRRSTANNVEIHIPVPNDADSPKFKTTVGNVKWVPENSEIVWSIKSFPGGKEYLMRAHFGLPSVEAEDKEGKPPISVKFEIPYFTTSGIQVRYLKIIEKSGYQALPWVRYITQNGDYQLRTQ
ncbi:AP-1 complex subunit mu-1 [Monodelphis domestica]|nr:AP-1 complex subunit mu-1 [Monodelphis domestica]